MKIKPITKVLYLDMDGTIFPLYTTEKWLERIQSEDATVFSEGDCMVDLAKLQEYVAKFQAAKWEVRILSCLPWGTDNKDFLMECRNTKQQWLEKLGIAFDGFHIIKYTDEKSRYVKGLHRPDVGVIVDDNPEVRKKWKLGAAIDPTQGDLWSKLDYILNAPEPIVSYGGINQSVKYRLVVDVETAGGGQGNQICYDVGIGIYDRFGKCYAKKSWMVSEMFNDRPEELATAFYASKISSYWNEWQKGKRELTDFNTIYQQVQVLCRAYDIQEVWAYNANFDKTALDKTAKRFLGKSTFFPPTVEVKCIWNLATQTVCKEKGYKLWCLSNDGAMTEKGNFKTSAEVVYRYIIQDPFFEEDHTGLEDVVIEEKILEYCLNYKGSPRKGIDTFPSSTCWKNVN